MLSVREMNESDIGLITNYWTSSDTQHLLNMGVDLKKIPSKDDLHKMLSTQLQLPMEEKRSYCIIWLDDDQPVGHCNTNPTFYGKEAFMHLHLWNNSSRRKGLGSHLIKLTLPYFFTNLQLKKLICEPYTLNPAPNKTLEKVGFDFEKEYTTIPGALNFEQLVKRWVLTQEKFKSLNNLL